MSDQVKISSTDALEMFRAHLIQYISKARVALEDMESDVRRTQTWLDTDCAQNWTKHLKLSMAQLQQAEEGLYSANLLNPQASNASQKMAVQKAQRKVDEAEEKVQAVKRWRKTFENRATPLVHQLAPLFQMLGQKLPQGVHSLGESVKALQAYAERNAPIHASPPTTSGTGGEP